MRITISKGGLNYLPNSLQNQQIWDHNKQLKQKMNNKVTNVQKQILKGENIPNDFCCERWLGSQCLKKERQQHFEHQNEVQIIKPQPRDNRNQQRTIQSQKKLIVVSNRSQQKLKLNFPRSLQCLRDFGKRQIKILNLQLPNKIKENEQTKKNTQFPLSRQISILSSISKQQVGTRQLSMIQSCENDKSSTTNKKLNLTVSRRSKIYACSNNQISERSQKQVLSTQKKQTQSIIYDKRQTTLHQSTLFLTDKKYCASESEFKIEDPFDEFKSLCTEYLKQKIAFSSVESEKQQIHHHVSQSIFNKNNLINPFLKKQTKDGNRDQQIFKQIKLQNQGSLSCELNSEESVVMQKNLQKMFQFSFPSFSKMATSEQSPAIYNSVILSSSGNERSLQ